MYWVRGAVPGCHGDAGELLHGLHFCSLHGCWGSLETDVTKLAGSCYSLRLDTVPESELGFLWTRADGASCSGGPAHLVSGWGAPCWVGKCSHESSADLGGDSGQCLSCRVYLCGMCLPSVSSPSVSFLCCWRVVSDHSSLELAHPRLPVSAWLPL